MGRKGQKEKDPVGYKKPPQHTQFKPGQSGNPKGRPKKTSTLPDVVSRELRAQVPIIKNGKRRKIPILEAIVKQYLNKAAGGDSKAAKIVFSLIKESQASTGNNLNELVQEFRAVYNRRVALDPDSGQPGS